MTPATPAAEAAEITARILLEIKSVLFSPDQPFTFTSGRKRPKGFGPNAQIGGEMAEAARGDGRGGASS